MAKPFLRWCGGKRKLASQIAETFPKEINTYWEPMVGGGAVFFYLQDRNRFKRAILSDINEEVINVYRAIRDTPDSVVGTLSKWAQHATQKEFYYQIREMDCVPNELKAARTIFLNRIGFNGLYRLNRLHNFNVPWGGPTRAKSLEDLSFIYEACDALQGVQLISGRYEKTTKLANPRDAIYVDPPYVPRSKTASFTSFYSKFDHEDHEALAKWAKEIADQNINIVLSNHDLPEVHALYSSFNCRSVDITHTIAAAGESRKKLKELIISCKKKKQ